MAAMRVIPELLVHAESHNFIMGINDAARALSVELPIPVCFFGKLSPQGRTLRLV
jgi:hypothetical protein